jgi:hypothetical protein
LVSILGISGGPFHGRRGRSRLNHHDESNKTTPQPQCAHSKSLSEGGREHSGVLSHVPTSDRPNLYSNVNGVHPRMNSDTNSS